jgi:hypothetical protein
LKGFNLEKYRPRVMLIEDNSRGADSSVTNWLKKKRYRRVHRIACNDWYVPVADCKVFRRKRFILSLRLLKWKFERVFNRK